MTSNKQATTALKLFFLIFAALSLESCSNVIDRTNSPGKSARPNIIIIFTDDQGYQDVGCFGSPLIKTPNLDRMATAGRRFTNFYVAANVCSPSRAALLTGCYPIRVGVPGVLFPNRSQKGLHPDEITIADMLKEQGYSAMCIGKWHLGDERKLLPTRQGFDHYYGIPYSNDMTPSKTMAYSADANWREGWSKEKLDAFFEKPKGKRDNKSIRSKPPLMRDEQCIEFPADQTTLTKRYTEEALKFIDENKDKPFFLYLAHTMPHVPLFASEKFTGKSQRGLYGDVIEEIDWSVGQILRSLKDKGVEKNTLVVFTSDNGPWLIMRENGGCALPLNGGKFETLEGGHRVPCIMQWPGTIPADSQCNELAATIDLLPTIAGVTGGNIPQDRIIDGKDVYPLIIGQPDAITPHEDFYYCKGAKVEAVRMGDWKYSRRRSVLEDPAKNNKRINLPPALFNLKDDVSEKNNLIEKFPDKAKQMEQAIAIFEKELNDNQRPAGFAGALQNAK